MVHKTYPSKRSMPSDRTPSTKETRRTGLAKGGDRLAPVVPRPESELAKAREVIFSFGPRYGSTFAERQEWRAEIMAMLGLR